MRRAFYIAVAGICIVLSWLAFAGGEAIPSKKEAGGGVVALVNGTPITLQSLTDMMNRLSLMKGHMAGADEERIRKEALDRLILEELAYQKAKAEGLKAGQAEVNKRVDELKVKAGGDEAFRQALDREGSTEDAVRADIERRVVLQRIFAEKVSDKVVISEETLKEEYEKEKDKFFAPEKITVVDVIFFLDLGSDASVKKAEGILGKINDDKEKNPWNLVPDGTFIVQETELKKEGERELAVEARKLTMGELSGVIKTSDSLHIIQLKKYTPRTQSTFEQAKGFLREKLGAEARQKRLREWEAELKEGAKIEIRETKESTE